MTITFVVETGEGSSTATSYASVSDIQQYWYNNNYDYSSITEDNMKRYLNQATLYVDANYDWPGYKQTSAQRLQWPRSGAYLLSGYEIEEDTVPEAVMDAVCELAYVISSGTDIFETINKEGKVVSATEKVDVISTSYTYESGSVMYQDILTKVDSILYDLTGGVTNNYIVNTIRVGGQSP